MEEKNMSDVDKITKELLQKSTTSSNIAQEFITTTRDKLELCLRDYLEMIKNEYSWLTPLGIFISIVTTLLTSDFHDYYLPATIWNTIYILSSMVTFIITIYLFKKRKPIMTIDEMIDHIKKRGLN